MAKQDQFRICPACETKNKAKWEFCVKCGESMQTVALGDPKGAATATGMPGGSSGALALAAMVVVIASAAYWGLRRPTPQNPIDPGAFQVATLPPATAPEAPAAPDRPGQRAYEMGRRLFSQGDLLGAQAALAQAVEQDPQNGDFHGLYAQVLFRGGQREVALRHFEQAAALSPRTASYRLGMAAALNTLGRVDDAVRQYEEVLRLEPGEPQAERDLGTLLSRQGRYDDAMAHLNRALERTPSDLALQQEIAYVLESKGDLAASEEAYRKILETAPEAAVSRARLSEVLLRRGRAAEALSLVEDGLKKNPGAPLLHRTRASLLERAGRIEEAIAEYREYARMAPNSEDSRALADRARQLEQKLKEGRSS